jgi:hypothetical protein
LECEADEDGQISFSVIEPSTVEGITGVVQGDEGTITYDGLQLVFPLMVYGQISPVSAPALLVSSWLKELFSRREWMGISIEQVMRKKSMIKSF